ncbi:hypothetical protein [Streptomyces sp. NPDC093600]|uniref:hypothetical protein n=1 Tax=Streptomyces sp. NPDC093600 TaxID=3366047 RepID=UPI003822D9FA
MLEVLVVRMTRKNGLRVVRVAHMVQEVRVLRVVRGGAVSRPGRSAGVVLDGLGRSAGSCSVEPPPGLGAARLARSSAAPPEPGPVMLCGRSGPAQVRDLRAVTGRLAPGG